MKSYVVGVDGGGTRTRALLADSEGNVRARSEGGLTNVQVVGPQKLAEVVNTLVEKLRGEPAAIAVSHVYLGLAGAGRATDRESAEQALRKAGLGDAFTVDTDASIALAGAFGGGPGIILISGTGTICHGRSTPGQTVRSGGWGYLLGDEGSGYYIGREGLLAALKDLDGRGRTTRLRARLEERCGVATIDQIVSRVYRGDLDRVAISSLAPIVFEEAKSGDEAAKAIVERAGQELGQLARAVAEKLDLRGGRVEVALVGSVFKQRSVLEPFILEELHKVSSDVNITWPRFEPVVGAVILGLQRVGVVIDETVLGNLETSFTP